MGIRMIERREYLSKVKRLVIKIGSSLLTDPGKKGIRKRFLNRLALEILELQKKRIQTVVVTSGAIAAGIFALGIGKKPKEISKLQALAAVGQSNLMQAYETTFNKSGLKVAQMLLTREDLSDRGRYTNAHNTLNELFRYGVVPVVNENDTVAVEEIKFGDNDTLGVLVTHLCEADLLVLLTDTDGFYSEDPRLNPKASLISDVTKIDGQLEKNASKSVSMVGTGGMQTKIRAAKSMMQSGVPMVIANGNTPTVVQGILKGEAVGTFFHPSIDKMNSRKRWLAWSVKPKGDLVIDEGAKRALRERNKSLLPAGIRAIRGTWAKGEVVKVIDLEGLEVAKGISNYSSRDLELIKGLKTPEIIQKLGPGAVDEAVHRDNMVTI